MGVSARARNIKCKDTVEEQTSVTYVDSYGNGPPNATMETLRALATEISADATEISVDATEISVDATEISVDATEISVDAPKVTFVHITVVGQPDGCSCALHMMWNVLCLMQGFEKKLAFPYWVSRDRRMLRVKRRLIVGPGIRARYTGHNNSGRCGGQFSLNNNRCFI